MLEPTKMQITQDFAEICRRHEISAAKIEKMRKAITAILAEPEDDEETISLEALFPDLHAGSAIRGLRRREELTQEQLAQKIGVKRSNISEMENGKRPIGKNMAKRLAKALQTDYKVFL